MARGALLIAKEEYPDLDIEEYLDKIATLAREAEPEPLIRSHAAWALGQIGGSAARRALERALGDLDAAVRDEGAAALEIN